MAEDFPAGLIDFNAGAQIASYQLEEEIGRGGMAVVYRARDVRLGRWVALKVLAQDYAQDEAFRQRFIRESRTAAAVDHPNIIPIFDAGEASGVLYIAMRYVAGQDVHSLLYRAGPLPAARALSIVSQVAAALDAAHACGLVHRDVKPANMLLGGVAENGRADHVYLSDFGISKQLNATTSLTLTGQVLGTLNYLAPEQIEGRQVDGRADAYALACAAFEMLAGAPPFRRDENMAVMWAQLNAPPPRLTSLRPDLPPAVDQVMGRALAKSPDARYPSCLAFSAALQQACGPALAAPDPTARPVPPPRAAAATSADPVPGPPPTPSDPASPGLGAPAPAGPADPASAGPPPGGLAGPASGGPTGPAPDVLAGPVADGPAYPASPGPANPSSGDMANPAPDVLAGPVADGPAYPGSRGPAYPSSDGPAYLASDILAGPVADGPAYPASGGLAGPPPAGLWRAGDSGRPPARQNPVPAGPGTTPMPVPGLPAAGPRGTTPPKRRGRGVAAVVACLVVLAAGGAAYAALRNSSFLKGTPATTGSSLQPGGGTGPVRTVRAYYSAITTHEYLRAWNLGGKNSGSTFSEFEAGLGTTRADRVIILGHIGDTVTARLLAVQTDGSVKHFMGKYVVQHGVIITFRVTQTS